MIEKTSVINPRFWDSGNILAAMVRLFVWNDENRSAIE
jgi:hypothetical protein